MVEIDQAIHEKDRVFLHFFQVTSAFFHMNHLEFGKGFPFPTRKMPATEAPTSSHSSEADTSREARHPLESSSPAAQAMGEGFQGPGF